MIRAGLQIAMDAAIGEFGRYRGLPAAMRLARASADEVRAIQLARLREVLTRAGRDVPHWRAVFATAGLDPARAVIEDLRALPVLTKADIRRSGDTLLADWARGRKLMRRQTGGSTGEPLVFWVTHAEYEAQMTTVLRSFSLVGMPPGTRVAKVWGYGRPFRPANAIAPFTGRAYLDAYSADDTALDRSLRVLERSRTQALYGYASALAALARHAARRSAHLPHLRTVCTTSETLFPEQRPEIEATLGRVHEMYGCHEVPRLAHECREGRLHMAPDAAVIEIVDDRVLLTSLQSHAMPFLRYDVGDRACWDERGPCPCGLPFDALTLDAGKAHYVFDLPGGSVHSSYFFKPLYRIDGVKALQIRRTAANRIELVIVPHPGRGADATAEAERIASGFRQRFPEVSIEVVAAEEIEPTASGKRPVVVSLV